MKNFSKIDRELRRMLVCTFGYSEVEQELIELEKIEVEDEVRKRCIEAICKKDMKYLKRDLNVYCSSEGIDYELKAVSVCLILYRYGIWQYVKNKVLYG